MVGVLRFHENNTMMIHHGDATVSSQEGWNKHVVGGLASNVAIRLS